MNDVQLGAVDLNVLVALDALLEERNVTAAARRIGLTPSAMSHALARLRELFRDPLLVRGKGGMLPTPRAMQLAVPVRRGLLDLQRALRGELSFTPATARRTFRVACTDYVAAALLPRLLARIAQEAPGVDLAITTIGPDLATVLESGGADVAIGPYLEVAAGMVQRHLFTEDFVCAYRRGHPGVRGRLDLETFTRIPHVLFRPLGRGRARVDVALEALGRERRVLLQVPHVLTALLLAMRRDLLMTAPRLIVQELADLWPIQVAALPFDAGTFEVKMVWHERFQHDPAHEWLRRTISDLAAAGGVGDLPRRTPRSRRRARTGRS
jgi:DNA-binding transcriptional LysR family regulator